MNTTKKQLAKKFVSNYVRSKISKIVGRANSSILLTLEHKCIDLNVKCLRITTLKNSGGTEYMFAVLDTECESTVVTIGYKYSPLNVWVSA